MKKTSPIDQHLKNISCIYFHVFIFIESLPHETPEIYFMYFVSGLFCLRMCLPAPEFPNCSHVPAPAQIPKMS
jgi:hypothetical protein